MKKIIRLTESDLKSVIKEILNENVVGQALRKPVYGTSTPANLNASSFNGKTVNLYSDAQNKNFIGQHKINVVLKNSNGGIVVNLSDVRGTRVYGDLFLNCTNPNKNQFSFKPKLSDNTMIKSVYNTPLSTQLRKVWCTVNTSGVSVPKSDFASNTQKPTSNFA
jgi:hypothetical protein